MKLSHTRAASAGSNLSDCWDHSIHKARPASPSFLSRWPLATHRSRSSLRMLASALRNSTTCSGVTNSITSALWIVATGVGA